MDIVGGAHFSVISRDERVGVERSAVPHGPSTHRDPRRRRGWECRWCRRRRTRPVKRRGLGFTDQHGGTYAAFRHGPMHTTNATVRYRVLKERRLFLELPWPLNDTRYLVVHCLPCVHKGLDCLPYVHKRFGLQLPHRYDKASNIYKVQREGKRHP